MKISLIDKTENRVEVDDVICKIRDLVNTRNLELGDKLPSERIMSEKLGVKRNHIREAISKLEFYGVLKSRAQSGTILSIGLIGFNGIVNEIIGLQVPLFKELVETRITLELKIVCLAAVRRTEEDLIAIKEALDAFKYKMENGKDYLEEDLLFHIAIAKASKNSTLLSLMLLITPSILATYERDTVCKGDVSVQEIVKHENVFKAIENQDVDLARETMKAHFYKLSNYINE